MSGGEEVAYWRALSDAVTDLALAGDLDAPAEALRRLCDGEWVARGRWQWSAWAGAVYETEREGIIPPERWQALKDGLTRGISRGFKGEPLPTLSNGFSFARKLPEHERVNWYWHFDRFETALLIAPDREESFSAHDIEVHEMPQPASVPVSPEGAPANKGGRPATWDWEAAALAMSGRFYLGDLKPKTIADVVRALQEWASSGGAPEMSDAAARPHAKRMFGAFRLWEPDL